MTVRPQEMDANPALLFAPAIQTALSTAVYETAPGGIYSHLADAPEESFEEEKVDVLGNGQSAAPPQSEPATQTWSPLVLAPSYGGAIVASFFTMMLYLQQMADQGYEVTADSAQAMIGTDGQNGLIASWVEAGCDAAEAQGAQIRKQAIGSLISASVSAISFTTMAGGFLKNSTDGIGTGLFQTERGKVSQRLGEVNKERTALDTPKSGELVTRSLKKPDPIPVDPATPNAPASAEKSAPADIVPGNAKKSRLVEARKKELIEGRDPTEETAPYTQQAVDKIHSLTDENGNPDLEAARKANDEKKKRLEDQLGGFDVKQKNLSEFLTAFNNLGSSAGSATGGMMAADEAVIYGQENAMASVLAQAGQTTQKVEEQASRSSQEQIQQMGQMAATMASALQSQVQSKA